MRIDDFRQRRAMSNNMSEATAKGLDQAAAHYAFRVFDDKKFRRLANFHTFSQVE